MLTAAGRCAVAAAGCIFAATSGGFKCQKCAGNLVVNKVRPVRTAAAVMADKEEAAAAGHYVSALQREAVYAARIELWTTHSVVQQQRQHNSRDLRIRRLGCPLGRLKNCTAAAAVATTHVYMLTSSAQKATAAVALPAVAGAAAGVRLKDSVF